MIELIWQLMAGHSLADFALQSNEMARGKNRNRPVDMSVVPPGQTYQPTWGYWLTAHALIHGGTVAYVTGRYDLGMAETVAHWLIDFGKCENKYGINLDQFLHFACKLVWVYIIWRTQ